MSKRKRAHHEEPEVVQVERPEAAADDDWDTSEFRQRVLIDLAFVTVPAVVMVLLGQNAIAAAWFIVGASVIVFQFQKQVRSFWRSLRAEPAARQNEDQEP